MKIAQRRLHPTVSNALLFEAHSFAVAAGPQISKQGQFRGSEM
jgi:hypothetical protein